MLPLTRPSDSRQSAHYCKNPMGALSALLGGCYGGAERLLFCRAFIITPAKGCN